MRYRRSTTDSLLRLLVVASFSLAPVVTASAACVMVTSDDVDHSSMHAHGASDSSDASAVEESGTGTTAAAIGRTGASPMTEQHGDVVVGACVADCATHFQAPMVGAFGPTTANSARTLPASAATPSPLTASIEHVPLV